MAYKNKEDAKAWRSANAEKQKEYQKRYQQEHKMHLKEQARLGHVRRYYGLSANEYLQMILDQNNKCAMCGQEETCLNKHGDVRPLCVDHDHVTGQVRSLLCNHCNAGLGNYQDSLERLEKAIQYLKKFKE